MRFSLLAAAAAIVAPVFADYPAAPAAPVPCKRGACLSDADALTIITAFHDILTNPDRQAANATAQQYIDENYTESSDSINSLAGFPLGSITFDGKTAFIDGVVTAPAIPSLTTLLSFHDCTHVAWHWLVTGLGSGAQEVKGTNLFTVNPAALLITDDQIEFNSIAWGADTGYTTLFPGQACPASA